MIAKFRCAALALTASAAVAAAEIPAWDALGGREAAVRTFAENEFGVRPVERPPVLSFAAESPDRTMMDGRAVRKVVRASGVRPL